MSTYIPKVKNPGLEHLVTESKKMFQRMTDTSQKRERSQPDGASTGHLGITYTHSNKTVAH